MAGDPVKPRKTMHLKDYMSNKVAGLAQRIRDGEVVAFDLAWSGADPVNLHGRILLAMPYADGYLECLEDDTPDAVQDDIKLLTGRIGTVEGDGTGAAPIPLEDLSAPDQDVVVPDPEVPPENGAELDDGLVMLPPDDEEEK